jgi:uncharacterized protein
VVYGQDAHYINRFREWGIMRAGAAAESENRLKTGGCSMGARDLLESKREEILRIAAKHGASNVRVFGSVTRGEDGPESDVDLLIDLEPGRSLLDHVALLQDLEDILSRKVDVVNEKALDHYIRDRVLREATPL